MPLPSQTLDFIVNGVTYTLETATSTEWLEATDLTGPVQIWVATRFVGTELQVEYELYTRATLTNAGPSRVEIFVAGVSEREIEIDRDWPPGRRLSGRLGPDLSIWSNWTNLYHRYYGPLEIPLPTISDTAAQETWAAGKLTDLRAVLAAGTGYVTLDDSEDGIIADAGWDGPWACWGKADPGAGAPGGSGIYHVTGWQNCASYAKLAAEVEAVAMNRMWCFYNADGTVVSADDYTAPLQPYCNTDAGIKVVPFSGYTDDLFTPQSLSHYSRVGRYVGCAYEMTGSRLARRHLISLAEMARLQFSERGAVDWTPFTGFISWNLANHVSMASSFGSEGINLVISGTSVEHWDRSHGWTMFFAAWAKKAGMTWTAGWADWASQFLGALQTSQMPNGLFSRNTRSDIPDENGDYFVHDVSSSFHEALIGMGILALSKQTNSSTNWLTGTHPNTLYRVAPTGPYSGSVGPCHYLGVGEYNNGDAYTTITHGFGEPSVSPPTDIGDPAHAETYIAGTCSATGNNAWLSDGLRFGETATTLAAKRAAMEAETVIQSRNWEASLLALIQGYSTPVVSSSTRYVRATSARRAGSRSTSSRSAKS